MSEKCGCQGQKTADIYNISVQEYTQQVSVPVDKLCNGVVVKNAGTTFVRWNGEPLAPGESKTVGGNEGEVFIGRIDLFFFTQTPAPATIIDSAWVTQKFFVGKNFV